MKGIIEAYHLFEKSNPFFEMSIRDIENLALRFMFLAQQMPDTKLALLKACMGEFSPSIKDTLSRKVFVNQLEIKLGVSCSNHIVQALIKVTPNFSIPLEKQYLIDALDQDLLMRESALQNKLCPKFKKGILTEGDSGLGKSTLLEAILAKHKITPNGLGSKKLTILTAGTEEASRKVVYAALLKAFHEGAVVMIDEIDLDKDLEKHLNQYLSGVDLEGKSAKIPGFMMLASKNASSMKGRKTVSPALLSRTHFMYMDAFSEKEVEAISRKKLMSRPNQLAKAFNEASSLYPDLVNIRTLYQVIEENEVSHFHDLYSIFESKIKLYKSSNALKLASINAIYELFKTLQYKKLSGRCEILLGHLCDTKNKSIQQHASQWFRLRKDSKLSVILNGIVMEFATKLEPNLKINKCFVSENELIDIYKEHVGQVNRMTNKI